MPLAPNTDNYIVGKGNVFFKKVGASDWRHVGNVPEFEFTPNIETLEHFSSMEGTKAKDKTIVIEKGGTLRIVMEEWVAENMMLALLGEPAEVEASTGVEAHLAIEILEANAISGAVKFVGNNDVGPRWDFEFNQVDFIPGASLNPISDEWGQIEVTGELVTVNGSFGTARVYSEELATP